MTTPHRGVRIAVCTAASALALTLAGCGASSATAPPAAAPTTEEDTTAEFCSADVDLESEFNNGPPLEALPPEAVAAAVADLVARVEPRLAAVEELAPEAVSADVTLLATTSREALATMDFAAFETPEFAAAEDNLDTWLLANCGFEQVEVTAADYEYTGLPDSLATGETAVTLTNEGEEFHEVAILRVNDGVTETTDELLALPMEESLAKVTVKGITFADPGGSDTSFIRFDEPGSYIAVCFIPEGTTPDAEGSGPPHFVLGMLAEFTVT